MVALRRGVGLVLGLILVAVLVSAVGMTAAFLLVGAEPTVPSQSTVVLRLRGDLPEVEQLGVFGPFLPRRTTVRTVVESLRMAKVDRRVKSLLVVPSATPTLWAKTQEVRDAILDFKRSGKRAVAFLEFGGDQEYYVATACDRIYLMPTSPLDVKGLASYDIFLRGTLDKVGAYPDFLHVGDYKTAINVFTETGYTPAHREMAESLNRDTFEQLVRGVAEGRKKSEADVRRLIDEGPFLPEEALRNGLVDELAYADEVAAQARLATDDAHTVEADTYAEVSPRRLGLGRGPRIAVIYVVGTIVSGRSSATTEGEVAGSDTIAAFIRKARTDGAVKAIVVRIDSGGGSAVASDVIWRELTLARAKKPVVASMSDAAASGGYWVAMASHAIVAQPGTLTGSIGIFAGKIVTGGTLEKLGARIEGVSNGRLAEMGSPVRPFNEAERAKLTEQLQAYYDQFVERVAEARRSTPEQIDAIAQGRVWTGRQAKELGLVDELGGLDHAVALAKQRAKIPAASEVELVVYPPRKSFYELVSAPFAEENTIRGWLGGLLLSPEERAAVALAGQVRRFRRGEPLALMPYVFVTR